MSETLTTFAAFMKELYDERRVNMLVYNRGSSFFGTVPKRDDFFGDTWVVPMLYSDPQGGSATFATALANKGNTSSVAFAVTHTKDYSLASIDQLAMRASANDRGAFLRAAAANIDGAFRTAQRSLSVQLYGDGSGARAAVASGVGTQTITLSNPEDVVRFEVGMQVQAINAANTTLRAGTVTITAINRSAGTLTSTSSTTWDDAGDGITGFVATDRLLRSGDRNSVLTGLGGWVPTTAPGSTAFFGVDRSVDTDRLGGVRFDGSSLSLEEALIQGQSRVAVNGGTPNMAFVNPARYRDHIVSLGSKVDYTKMPAQGPQGPIAEIGFRGVVVEGDVGPITVMPDIDCAHNLCYMLQMDTWMLRSLGGAPHIFPVDDKTGTPLMTESSNDAFEVRVGTYGNLACNAPGFNGVITLPT